jgi:hypothetical protein
MEHVALAYRYDALNLALNVGGHGKKVAPALQAREEILDKVCTDELKARARTVIPRMVKRRCCERASESLEASVLSASSVWNSVHRPHV